MKAIRRFAAKIFPILWLVFLSYFLFACTQAPRAWIQSNEYIVLPGKAGEPGLECNTIRSPKELQEVLEKYGLSDQAERLNKIDFKNQVILITSCSVPVRIRETFGSTFVILDSRTDNGVGIAIASGDVGRIGKYAFK